jgi:hypothetical protein
MKIGKKSGIEKSSEVLRKAIDKAGVKAVANSLNLSSALVYKWCEGFAGEEFNFESSGTINPLDRIKTIYEVTQDIELINWLCRIANGFFVTNPLANLASPDEEIFKNTQTLIREFSETLNAISKSYSDDKRIDKKEAHRIRREWEDLKRIGERFVKECELGSFGVDGGTTKKRKKRR